MAKLTERQKQLCIEWGFFINPTKKQLIYAMLNEDIFNDKFPFYMGNIDKANLIYNKYTLKDLDEMLDYKQLNINEFCDMKEY